MKLNKSFKCIEVKLNHRLVRKLIKVFEEYVKKYPKPTLDYDWQIYNTYKYLKRLWKHKNYKRFNWWYSSQRINKQINKRVLIIYTDRISIYTVHDSNIVLEKNFKSVEEIFKWFFSKRNDCPF